MATLKGMMPETSLSVQWLRLGFHCRGLVLIPVRERRCHIHIKNNSTFIMEIKGNIEKNKQVLSFEAIKNDQLSLKKDQGLMGMKNKIILKDTAQ